MAEEVKGHYEWNGDVAEWKWDPGHEPKVTVPEGEFDPRDPKPVSTKTAPAVVPPKAKKATKK